jgi:predicted PilT family ATPase
MAIKELTKSIITEPKQAKTQEDKVQKFIAQGGSIAQISEELELNSDHRLTLRIPKELLKKIDSKRKERIGKISRNLWILEQIEKATTML